MGSTTERTSSMMVTTALANLTSAMSLAPLVYRVFLS